MEMVNDICRGENDVVADDVITPLMRGEFYYQSNNKAHAAAPRDSDGFILKWDDVVGEKWSEWSVERDQSDKYGTIR